METLGVGMTAQAWPRHKRVLSCPVSSLKEDRSFDIFRPFHYPGYHHEVKVILTEAGDPEANGADPMGPGSRSNALEILKSTLPTSESASSEATPFHYQDELTQQMLSLHEHSLYQHNTGWYPQVRFPGSPVEWSTWYPSPIPNPSQNAFQNPITSAVNPSYHVQSDTSRVSLPWSPWHGRDDQANAVLPENPLSYSSQFNIQKAKTSTSHELEQGGSSLGKGDNGKTTEGYPGPGSWQATGTDPIHGPKFVYCKDAGKQKAAVSKKGSKKGWKGANKKKSGSKKAL
ncbi:hypothetical protein F5Y11DRAFT_350217 [Daldinia sp. FL1419]|nr:hypothetical protein F5Y11DRAFT_350217 [Daldinia sp. FL1419]